MTAAERQAAREAFFAEAAARWDAMFDPTRQGELRTFDQREEEAVNLSRALGAKLLEQHLKEEAGGPAAPSVACPLCGQAGELRSQGDGSPGREVRTRVGSVEYARPEYHCGRCRRSFFPDGPDTGAGNGRV